MRKWLKDQTVWKEYSGKWVSIISLPEIYTITNFLCILQSRVSKNVLYPDP